MRLFELILTSALYPVPRAPARELAWKNREERGERFRVCKVLDYASVYADYLSLI